MIIEDKAKVHLVDQIVGVLSHKKRSYLLNARDLFFNLEPNLLKTLLVVKAVVLYLVVLNLLILLKENVKSKRDSSQKNKKKKKRKKSKKLSQMLYLEELNLLTQLNVT